MQLDKIDGNKFYCAFQKDDKDNSDCHQVWKVTELVMEIFSYLEILDLINLSQTCKGFNLIAYDDYLWNKFILQNIKDKFPEKTIKDIFIYEFTNLKNCSLENIDDFWINIQKRGVGFQKNRFIEIGIENIKIGIVEFKKCQLFSMEAVSILKDTFDKLKPILELLTEDERAIIADTLTIESGLFFHPSYYEIISTQFNFTNFNIINNILAKSLFNFGKKLCLLDPGQFIEICLPHVTDPKQIEEILQILDKLWKKRNDHKN